MKPITREAVKQKIDSPDTPPIIEVLSEENFKEFHLPGAANVPVHDDDFDRRIQEAVPDKNQPVIVYCANKDCPASENAARRMEELGYRDVYDYEEGKEDWEQAGLPVETVA